MSDVPAYRPPVEILRNGQRVDPFLCLRCRWKVQPVKISGTVTEVQCPKCRRRWVISGMQTARVR